MSERATHRRTLIATSLVLAGPFAFIQALLFRPKMLTPYLSGVEPLVSTEVQTIAAVVLLAIACFACGRLLGKNSPGAVALFGVALPLISIGLVLGIRSIAVPVIVACLLAISCGVLLRMTLTWRPFDAACTLEDFGTSAIISLGASSLLTHIGYAIAPNDAYGTALLALVMALAGALMFALSLSAARCTHHAPPAAASGEHEEGPTATEGSQGSARAIARTIAPIVPAGIICSLSLGTSSADASLEAALRLSEPFAAGLIATVGILAALVFRWRRHSEEQCGDIVLFMALPCALAAAATCLANTVSFLPLFAVLVCSNSLFFALIWIDMLYLARRKAFALTPAPIVSVLIMLGVSCVGMLLAAALPPEATTVVAPLAAIGYLVYLVFYFQKQQADALWDAHLAAPREADANEARPSFDEIRIAACKAMARDFGLSPKESEVLPLLVTGISASAIGRQLFISHETVKTHKYHIYQKIGVHNFEEAIEVFERYANKRDNSAMPSQHEDASAAESS